MKACLLMLGLLASAVVAMIWWHVPRLQARRLPSEVGAHDHAKLEDEFRKTVTGALTGAVLLLSATLAFEQLNETRDNALRQIEAANRTTDITSNNQQLARGFELLGKRTAAERLGGIRLLEDWASRKSADHRSDLSSRFAILIPALHTFVKERSSTISIKQEICELFKPPQSAAIANDLQAAIDVISTRSLVEARSFDFRGTMLSRASFSGAQLDGSSFAFADLLGANLRGASLRNVNFYCANLYGADLSGADLSGDSLDGSGSETNLAGAQLIQARMMRIDGGRSTSLRRANLSSAILSEASLNGVDLRGARLWDARLFRTSLTDVVVDKETDIDQACLLELRGSDEAFAPAKHASDAVKVSDATALPERSRCTRPYTKQE